jgi:hypothetical protein
MAITHIGFGERRRIVDAVASHGHNVPFLLLLGDQRELVFRP